MFIKYLVDRNYRVRIYDNATRAEAAFKAGRLDAIVILPDSDKGVVNMKLVLPDMDAQATAGADAAQGPYGQRYENFLARPGRRDAQVP